MVECFASQLEFISYPCIDIVAHAAVSEEQKIIPVGSSVSTMCFGTNPFVVGASRSRKLQRNDSLKLSNKHVVTQIGVIGT